MACGVPFFAELLYLCTKDNAPPMKVYFDDDDLRELIFDGKNKGKYKKLAHDARFVSRLNIVYNTLCAAERASALTAYSYLHYERLRHNGCSSVRVVNGRVERLIFKEVSDGVEIILLELNQDHYGNKK